jgi:1-phosphofructokinase family hexose kinase
VIHTLTLSPAIDRTYVLDHLLENGVSRAKHVLDAPSGKGVNVFRVASMLGAEASATVLLGGPLGAYFQTLFDPEWSIDVIPIEQNTRLNVSLVVHEPEMTLKINEEVPELTEREVEAVLHYLDRRLRPGDWLAICGSTPTGSGGDVYPEIRRLADSRDVQLALDVPNLSLSQLLEVRPTLYKPNASEFAKITSRSDATLGELVRSAERLARLSRVEYVIVTLGHLGALISTDGESLYLPIANPVQAQPVGAGDALLAGFLTGVAAGERWRNAFVRGVAASYAAATTGPTERLAAERVDQLTSSLRDGLAVPDDEVKAALL